MQVATILVSVFSIGLLVLCDVWKKKRSDTSALARYFPSYLAVMVLAIVISYTADLHGIYGIGIVGAVESGYDGVHFTVYTFSSLSNSDQ